MANLDSILRSRDITLPTKVHLVKVMVFPVVMYGCDSWTVRKAERGKIDAFELWCWRRLLRVPWTARRYNQSILKEISPGCSLEVLMLKLKLQYIGHLAQRVDSLEKTLMLGGLRTGGQGDDRGWSGWMALLTRWAWVWVNSGSLWWTGRPVMLRFMGSQRVGHDWATELSWCLLTPNMSSAFDHLLDREPQLVPPLSPYLLISSVYQSPLRWRPAIVVTPMISAMEISKVNLYGFPDQTQESSVSTGILPPSCCPEETDYTTGGMKELMSHGGLYQWTKEDGKELL